LQTNHFCCQVPTISFGRKIFLYENALDNLNFADNNIFMINEIRFMSFQVDQQVILIGKRLKKLPGTWQTPGTNSSSEIMRKTNLFINDDVSMSFCSIVIYLIIIS
jgi:hypothetical protein